MNCEEVQRELSEYLDGVLEPSKYRAIEDHLASCARCLPEAHLLSGGIKAVAGLPEMEPPAGFSQRVMAQIRTEAEPAPLWERLFLPFRIKIPLHAMGLLLVIGLAVYLYQANEPIQREMTPSIRPEPSPSPQQASPPPMERGATRPERKEESPTIVPPTVPPAEERFNDGNLAAKETDRLKSSDRAERTPAARELAKSKKMESMESQANAPAGAAGQEKVAADEAVAPDVVLTLNFQGVDPIAALTSRVKQAAEPRGGKVFALIKDRPEETSQLHYWLNLPRSEYGRFKKELSQIGTLLSESQLLSSTPKSDMKPSIQVKVTFLLKKPEEARPADPLLPPQN
jgi:hypothetical protein